MEIAVGLIFVFLVVGVPLIWLVGGFVIDWITTRAYNKVRKLNQKHGVQNG
jgi:hypothetical protein